MRREVQLRPAFASHYPALEPGRWYTAAAVAGLVKGTLILELGPDAEFTDRVLPATHFVFRGGSPRHGSWLGQRTRRVDRHRAAH